MAHPPEVRRSLRWRLPLLVSALVAGVLAFFLVASYLQARNTLLVAGGARAQAAADQLVSLTSPTTRQRLADTRRAAAEPVLRNYLLHPTAEGRRSVEQLLRTLTPPGVQVTTLWSHDGPAPVVTIATAPEAESLIGAGLPPRASGLLLTETSTRLVISETTEAIASASPSAPAGDVGYLRIRRPALSGSSADTLNRLVGGGAHIGLGSRSGWTDLVTLVPPPPIDLGRKGVQEFVTAGGEHRLGALAELTGTPWSVWIDFPRSAILAPAATFLERMTLIAIAFVILAGVGSRVVTGRISDLLAATRDREHALQALRESEAHYRTIVDVALDCIITIDRHGHVVEFNPAAEATFGYRRADVIGRQISDLIIPESGREAHRQRMRGYFATGQGVEIGRLKEVTVMRADGHEFPVEASVHVVQVHGEPMLTAYVRDISARRVAEAARIRSVELEADNRRVREANRLKSAFLANMSHELRTPLNSIIGFSSILHDGKVDPADERHREFLGYIVTSGKHLLQVINDVLDLSKIEAGKLELHPEPCELDRVIDEVLSVMQSTTVDQQFVTTVSVDPAVRQVVLDPARLKQVLYNYLSNAFKFTPAGGTVDIRAVADGPEMFRLEVADSGIGIADADLGRLFQDFQQLDNGASKPHAGTGLGLALTRRLVEAQGGTVGVRSLLGEGSVFHVRLPRHHQIIPAVTPLVAGAAGSTEPGSPDRILVVDDDECSARLLAVSLECLGYSVEFQTDAQAGLASAVLSPPSAIVLDLMMPRIDGFQFIDELRGRPANRTTPVIVWTVKDLSGDEARRLEGAALAVLHKSQDNMSHLVHGLQAALAPAAPGRG